MMEGRRSAGWEKGTVCDVHRLPSPRTHSSFVVVMLQQEERAHLHFPTVKGPDAI